MAASGEPGSTPALAEAPGPSTSGLPAVPPAAHHPIKSQTVSYTGEPEASTLPKSPSALPDLPPTPGLAQTMSAHDASTDQYVDANGHSYVAQSQSGHQQDATDDDNEEGQNGPSAADWSPAHPCFPHPNPHVPLSSPLYDATRIIRIPRDWMAAGDLYPAFSTTYPEILLPWLSENEFRDLINHVNEALRLAFEPATGKAVLDGVLGLLSGWLLEDAGVAGPKKRVRYVEAIIENWNAQHVKDVRSRMDKGYGMDVEGSDLVAIVPLRRTAYMSLDIQIPDPKITVVDPVESTSGGQKVEQAGAYGDNAV